MASGKIKIVLADDHTIMRQGLRNLLDAEPDFDVIGEAGDGPAALDLIREKEPDILVLDLMMPGMSGMEVMEKINPGDHQTKVVVLSMHADYAHVHQALKRGASAYVIKDASADDLVKAVRKAHGGERYLSAPLSEKDIRLYERKVSDTGADPYDNLTKREHEVFFLVIAGVTSADIARQLAISRRTVEAHRANLLRKLGIRSPTELIRYAISRGLLAEDA